MQLTPQRFSHYPAWPAPVDVPLSSPPEQPCPYLPRRMAQARAILVRGSMPPEMYHDFMDAGFRRSGRLLYQPACRQCRACTPIRVFIGNFAPDKSQRRCWRRNADLHLVVARPEPTDEKYALYRRYLKEWHRGAPVEQDDDRAGFESFLYDSPLDTVEFTYFDSSKRLVAVGICDVSPRQSLSSVYCYFDPAVSRRRGLGTYAALREIDYARSKDIPHYYLGFWVHGCRSMSYKTNFKPHELLGTDGIWRAEANGQGNARTEDHVGCVVQPH